jgi:hypothetical protein
MLEPIADKKITERASGHHSHCSKQNGQHQRSRIGQPDNDSSANLLSMRRSLASFTLIIAAVIAQQKSPSAMAATAMAAAPVAVGAELEKALEGLDSGLVRLRYPSILERVLTLFMLSCRVDQLHDTDRHNCCLLAWSCITGAACQMHNPQTCMVAVRHVENIDKRCSHVLNITLSLCLQASVVHSIAGSVAEISVST